MCGIFTIISNKDISTLETEKYYKEGIKSQHRGPDNTSASLIQSNIYMMFHRLKINDMSNLGNQPLYYDENLLLICNGEIYNWKELACKYNLQTKSRSDCEIILHLYKMLGMADTIKLLDGVFAFVLVDKTANKVFAGRDPIGVRSMYIGYTSESIGIASECSNLCNLYDKVDMFRPGTYIELTGPVWNSGDIIYNRYYSYIYPEITEVDESDILTNIRTLLTKSVEKRLLSERPIGCLLSGGFDSSVITALVAKYYKESGTKLKTYSIGLEGAEDLKYARIVADYIGTDHHEYVVTKDEMLYAIDEVIKNIESYDITTVRASIPMYLLSKYIKENTDTTIIFSGEGSDEASGSYIYFHNAPNEIEFQKEIIRLLKDLQYFDVLRCDKTTASNGLEVRVPFLDKDFLKYYVGLHAKYKLPNNYSMEKFLLRKAFKDILPSEVTWRIKEGMSDGVSSHSDSWFQIIQDHVDKFIHTDQFHDMCSKYEHNTPKSKEALYYRIIFDKYFNGQDTIIPYYWLPKWSGNISEPSARILNVYKEQNQDNTSIQQALDLLL